MSTQETAYPLIGNRYQLREKLGSGGMGTVYRATDRLNNEEVALKQVLLLGGDSTASPSSDGDALRLSISREFRTVASLHHPNVIGVLDYGFDSDRQPYFTMDLLTNPQPLTEAGHTLPIGGKIRLLIDMLHGLAYVHRRGIVHRDLKPANVLVDHAGRVKVLDFGLALQKTASEVDDGIVGTVNYIAPEIFMGGVATAASDLYAVGVMAYELFARQFPYDDSTTTVLVDEILRRRPDFSLIEDPLSDVVERLLEKQPERRYPDAASVIAALCQAIDQPVPQESIEVRESFLQASAFVGRETEFTSLTDALTNAANGKGSSWLLGGESGVGKSRLLEELRTWALVKDILVLRGQGVARNGLPYQLWRDALRRLALSTSLSDLELSILKDVVPDIGGLLGRIVADAAPLEIRAARQRLSLTIMDVFKRQTQPVMLVLEDLQWAGESLEPLRQLNRFVGDQPWLIVASYRDDEAADLPEKLADMQTLKIGRLNENAIAELSASMLGEAGRENQILTLLKRETEGNAFFMVEVVRALAEEAGTLGSIGRKSLPQRVLAGGVQQVIQRRLNHVPPRFRSLLNLTALLGRELDTRILEAAHKTTSTESSLDVFLTLCANAAILETADGVWRFAHDKLREAVLDDLPESERPPLYRALALAIEQTYPGDEKYAEILVEQWHLAGDAAKTLAYTIPAVERLMNISAAYSHATQVLQRSLMLTEKHSELAHYRPSLLILMGDLSERQSQFAEATKYYESSLATGHDDPVLKVKAWNGLGQMGWREENYDRGIKFARQALELARELGHRAGIALSLSVLGNIAGEQSQYTTSQHVLEEALAIYRELGDQRGVGVTLNNLGSLAYAQGHMESARDYFTQALEIRRTVGDRRGIAISLNNLAAVSDQSQQDDTTWKYLEESLKINREIGDRAGIASAMNNLGVLAASRGQYEIASQLYEESLQIERSIGRRQGIAYSMTSLGGLAMRQGHYQQAQIHFTEALTIAREIEHPLDMAYSLNRLGEAAEAQGDYATAQTYFEESINIAREHSQPVEMAIGLCGLAFVALDRGDKDEARRKLHESLLTSQDADWELETAEPALCAAWLALEAGQKERAAALLAALETTGTYSNQFRTLRQTALQAQLASTPVERAQLPDLTAQLKAFLADLNG